MADQLCTPDDLASLLGITVDDDKAVVLIECASAVVQEAAGNQRLVEVEDDEGVQMGTMAAWLILPQRPVTAISEVEIDGEALVEDTDYVRYGSQLYRRCGWATCWPHPSKITYTYTHGYADGSQDLQLARSATLSLIRAVYANPTGASREAIDDYSIAYDQIAAAMEASPILRASLKHKYGDRAGLVRAGA